MKAIDGAITWFARLLLYVGGAGLVGMLVLTVSDVIGIKVFHRPIPGGIEYVTFLSVVAIAFSVGYTQVVRGHVAVDFIVTKFPHRAKLIIDVCMMLLSVCLFALLSYYTFRLGGRLRASGEVSMTQRVPFYPFVYAMAFCLAVTFLVLVSDLAKSIVKAVTQWTR